MFIIDALRLDFIANQPAVVKEEHTPQSAVTNTTLTTSAVGQGKTNFPYIHQILEFNASQSRLFGFRADPPTVTSQRLQGITSGSLPTFIDIGSNLNGEAIQEDNIIDQMLAAEKRYALIL
jgi:predicted AlkP superfamily pyrophosphatase or phosphodiesterase